MESRAKLLEAAARVYAASGFRGATTRRIAEAAGVNEVTIFRHFGSKAALIDAALRCRTVSPGSATYALPETPVHPERELIAWCAGHLAHLRAMRALILKTMGEVEERPQTAPCGSESAISASAGLRQYIARLYDAGFIGGALGRGGRNENAHAAGAMLMGALFADAMGRDVMPELYPQPADRAPALYARLFLRALGVRSPKRTAAVGRRAKRRTPLPSPSSRS